MPIGFINAQLQPQLRLPTGQVTFLLTDIEGSTGLLNRLGDEYASLLANVRRVVRGAIRSTGGHRVSARGDDHSSSSSAPPTRSRGRLRSSARCRRPTGPATATFACASAFIAAARSSPRPLRQHLGPRRPRIYFTAHGGRIMLSSAVARPWEQPLPGTPPEGTRPVAVSRPARPLTMFELEAPDLAVGSPAPLRHSAGPMSRSPGLVASSSSTAIRSRASRWTAAPGGGDASLTSEPESRSAGLDLGPAPFPLATHA